MYLKAAYTVEAALVMGICLITVAMCIMLSFKMYHETVDYIGETTVSELDPVDRFRKVQTVKDIAEGIFER